MRTFYAVFAKNAFEARSYIDRMRLRPAAYVGLPALLDPMSPGHTTVVFVPGWQENKRAAQLFEKAFGLGLING